MFFLHFIKTELCSRVAQSFKVNLIISQYADMYNANLPSSDLGGPYSSFQQPR